MSFLKILAVEDDISLKSALSYKSTKEGYQVAVAKDGVKAVNHFWLREKIEPDPTAPKHLITVRGTGYKLEG